MCSMCALKNLLKEVYEDGQVILFNIKTEFIPVLDFQRSIFMVIPIYIFQSKAKPLFVAMILR